MASSEEAERHTSPVPELSEIPPPRDVQGMVVVQQTGKSFTPAQQIATYSPDEWEDFILEWVTGLGDEFLQAKKLGGPGDRGIDVAAFKTEDGFEGPWVCYQAKHYSAPLAPSDAFPEMLKIFSFAQHYGRSLPEAYLFVATQGCGATLNRMLSTPTHLKNWFLERVDSRAAGCDGFNDVELQKIREAARATNFSMFRSVELHEMVEQHRKTPHFVVRFGGPLPPRPSIRPAPDEPDPVETRYLQKLVDVYAELDPSTCQDLASASAHRTYGPHLQRQRESFYSAESLRLYARDAVPPGSYEALQEEVFEGVIETAETTYESGMERLRAVLSQSGQLALDNQPLISVSRLSDRKGICQQLANLDRLTWVQL